MDWPIATGWQGLSVVVNPVAATSDATSVTAGGSANTKGSWVEVSASWPGYGGLTMATQALGGVDSLLDIGIGSAGSEVVVAENVYAGNGASARLMAPFCLPLMIPSGARVSVRSQASTASSACSVFITSSPQPVLLGRCTTYGANTGDSGGVQVDPGLSSNTKGAWVTVTASTTSDIKAFILVLGVLADLSRPNTRWLIDVAVGGAGAEQVIVSDYGAAARSEHDAVLPQVSQLMPIQIPAGSRIAIRAQCDITTLGDRLFDAIIYGFD